MMTIQNAAKIEAINAAGASYAVRKYAGAWVPVVVIGGKRKSFAHCATSGAAMQVAIDNCAKACGFSFDARDQ